MDSILAILYDIPLPLKLPNLHSLIEFTINTGLIVVSLTIASNEYSRVKRIAKYDRKKFEEYSDRMANYRIMKRNYVQEDGYKSVLKYVFGIDLSRSLYPW